MLLDLSSDEFLALEDINLIFFNDETVFEKINGNSIIEDTAFHELNEPDSQVEIDFEFRDGVYHVKQTPILFYLGWKINSAKNLIFELQATTLQREHNGVSQSMNYRLSYFDNKNSKYEYLSGADPIQIRSIEYLKGMGEQMGAIPISFIPEDDSVNREILLGPSLGEGSFSGTVTVKVKPKD
ncbi:MAG: hypothetical protein KBS81_06330 [Spirochaetales bacterium]|nr:hypothetical protein [Candidatus Physcosoma equi]